MKLFKKTKSIFYACALYPLLSTIVKAEVINVTGTVIASPCTLDSTNSTLAVDLGSLKATSLATASTATLVEKIFKLVLKDCPASTRKVTATFSGTAYSANKNAYANSGTATNIGVVLKRQADTWSSPGAFPGAVIEAYVDATTKTVTFPLSASYTTSGNVMPGTISAAITVTFSYE